jgi:hypothetical protein
MTARTLAAEHARPLTARIDTPALGAWTLGFAVIGYLALKGGGYDIVVRSQVGIGVWWIVLLGVAVGVLPQVRTSRAGAAAVGLLTAFAAFSALSALWSESPERAIGETARIVTLLGVLVLAVATVRAHHARPLVNGVFAAIVGVGALACVSRLHPAWFGDPETAQFLTGARSRLSYGLNYWNSLGAFMALGLPLGMAVSMSARSIAGRAAALAALPVLALTLFFTISRGGVLAAAIGLIAAVLLTPQRGRWLAKLAVAAAGTAILIKGAIQRDELRDGLTSALARDQGNELLVVALVVLGGIVLVHIGLSLARAGGLVPESRPLPRTAARAVWAVVLVAAIGGATTFVASGELSDRWAEFKSPHPKAGDFHRLSSVSGQGRYKMWVSSVDAFEQAPVAGLGAGSFENWWERNALYRETVRNAHSLYAETLAELGLIGMLLIVGLIILVIAAGAWSVRRATGPPTTILAGATAACVAFAVVAGVDWHWQVTVLPACFVLLAAAVLAPARETSPARGPVRWLLVGLAVAALAALVVPLAATTQLRASQSAALANELDPALQRAGNASRVQPYASSPQLQRALVLELRGDLDGAVAAAQAAQRKEPTNWRPPFVLARLHAAQGDTTAAVAAFRRAKSLNKTAAFLQ